MSNTKKTEHKENRLLRMLGVDPSAATWDQALDIAAHVIAEHASLRRHLDQAQQALKVAHYEVERLRGELNAAQRVTRLDEYERWAMDKIDSLREQMEDGEVVAFAMVMLRPHGSRPGMTLHHMAKAGEAHRLLGGLHELAYDVTAAISEEDV